MMENPVPGGALTRASLKPFKQNGLAQCPRLTPLLEN